MLGLCSGCLFIERSYGLILQKCNMSTECAQATQTTTLCGPQEYDWEDLSQVLSFTPDGTSAEQVSVAKPLTMSSMSLRSSVPNHARKTWDHRVSHQLQLTNISMLVFI